MWEPLIELVDDGYDKWARWDLKVTANGRNALDPKDKSPAMDVKIEGERVLNITVTKSCIQLLYKLSDVRFERFFGANYIFPDLQLIISDETIENDQFSLKGSKSLPEAVEM